MKQAFKLLFLGYLFIFLDFHIMIIDILPDCVGFFLIYQAIIKLTNQSSGYSVVKVITVMLLIYAIPSDIQLTKYLSLDGFNIFYDNVYLLLNIIWLYYIFSMLLEVVRNHGTQGMLRRTETVAKVCIVAQLFIMFINGFMINLTDDEKNFLAIGILVIGFSSAVILLRYFYNMEMRFANIKKDISD